MNPLDKLLDTIQNLPDGARLLGNASSTERFCLTTQRYSRPKEIVDMNGSITTQSLKAQSFSINVYNEKDYNLFKTLFEDFISSTTDKFKVRIPEIRTSKEIIPLPEFKEHINSVCLARKSHENMVDSLVSNFEKQMKILGVSLWIEGQRVEHWPTHCQFKETWFEHVETPDFTHYYQFGMTFHENTELYKRYKPIIRKIDDYEYSQQKHSQNQEEEENSQQEEKSRYCDVDYQRYIEEYRYKLYGQRHYGY